MHRHVEGAADARRDEDRRRFARGLDLDGERTRGAALASRDVHGELVSADVVLGWFELELTAAWAHDDPGPAVDVREGGCRIRERVGLRSGVLDVEWDPQELADEDVLGFDSWDVQRALFGARRGRGHHEERRQDERQASKHGVNIPSIPIADKFTRVACCARRAVAICATTLPSGEIAMSIAAHIVAVATELGAEISEEAVTGALSTPKNRELGDVAFPCFILAKALRAAPPKIASDLLAPLRQLVEADPELASVEQAGPYLNFRFDRAQRSKTVLQAAASSTYGRQSIGEGVRVGIDFSSPNIAKPFGIGHLRATGIGAAIGRIYRALGYTVIGVNHIGDWGTQFGKLIAAFEWWGDRAALAANPIDHLYELYTRFHRESKEDPSLDDAGREWFRKLEGGDEKATAYWTEFRELSLREFDRIYDRLGVSFEHVWGEAYYNEMLADVVEDVQNAGVAVRSEGALVVPMEHIGIDNPCIILKADGATIYATRDLAAARYRVETLELDKLVYVVGAPQTIHFRQVFEVLRQLGYEWSENLVHVPFGKILGMSTREGTLVFVEEMLATARAKVMEHIGDREGFNADELEALAEQIAVGSLVFFDLSRNRMKDYDFSYEAMLKGIKPGERGPTGVYLQYTIARLNSLLAKYESAFGALPDASEVHYDKLATEAADAIVAHLERWPAELRKAAETHEPAVVARFALEAAERFNGFYSGGNKVISDDAELSAARVMLAVGVRNAIAMCLELLGVPMPERM